MGEGSVCGGVYCFSVELGGDVGCDCGVGSFHLIKPLGVTGGVPFLLIGNLTEQSGKTNN